MRLSEECVCDASTDGFTYVGYTYVQLHIHILTWVVGREEQGGSVVDRWGKQGLAAGKAGEEGDLRMIVSQLPVGCEDVSHSNPFLLCIDKD